MGAADWRSADAYQELRLLDAPAFAFEFLRRNPEFLKDHARLVSKSSGQPLDPADAIAFAERWGVRFRKGITRTCRRRRFMDSQGAPKRRRSDKGSRGPDQS
jgi:hypothetical protein